VRVAYKPFARAAEINATLADACMHSTSPSIAAACAATSAAAGEEIDALLAASSAGLTTAMDAYVAGLPTLDAAQPPADAQQPRASWAVVWARIERAVAAAVLAGAPLLSTYAAMLRGAGSTYRTSAVLAIDVQLTETAEPVLEEMHVAQLGRLLGRPPRRAVDQRAESGGAAAWERETAREALTLLGTGGYPRRAQYATHADALMRAVCEGDAGGGGAAADAGGGSGGGGGSSGCDETNAAMWQLADEAAHAGRFSRLFPPPANEQLDVIRPLAADLLLNSAPDRLSAEFALRLGSTVLSSV
jgi:hypothetical protein